MPSVDPLDTSESNAGARELLESILSQTEEPGTLFGGYLLYEVIGRGGFGVVFRARRLGSDQVVALKQMWGGAQATAEERREFLVGAETAMLLDHPGIVRVRDLGESADCPFFTMDWVPGMNLAQKTDQGPCSWGQAARWLHSIALAVDHAHSRGVLHGDLKPANILLDAQAQPFVADFGSARHLTKEGQCVDSGDGVLSCYMAPEQALGDARSLSTRSDIYSLGVILYELLTGCIPNEDAEDQKKKPFGRWMMELVSRDPVRPPRELDPSVHPGLELVCLKCLEKIPASATVRRRYWLKISSSCCKAGGPAKRENPG